MVLGCGGHAKVCVEILQSMGEIVAYCIGNKDSEENCLGIQVLKGNEHIPELASKGFSKAFIAIGSNAVRSELAAFVLSYGFTLVNAISPDAIISPSVSLGSGIAVMAGAVVNASSSINNLSIVNTGATIDHDCIIGNATHIGPQCALAGNVTIGENTFLGIGTKVIPRVTIGRDSVIGAGSVVITDIPPFSKAIGVPVKISRMKL